MRTVITDRDMTLLSTLASYELLTTRQIGTLVFRDLDKRTVLRRLRKLEREKVIKKIHGLKLGELAWALNQYGAFRLGIERQTENINRNSLEHDTTLTDIRIAFEQKGIASQWTTEQHLRRSIGRQSKLGQEEIVPDAVFAGRTKKGFEVFALELELSGKSPSRYARVFSNYAEKNHFSALWYIVGNETLGKRLATEWEKANPNCLRPQFAWMLLSDVLANPECAKVHNKGVEAPLDEVLVAPKSTLPITRGNAPMLESRLPTPSPTGWAG